MIEEEIDERILHNDKVKKIKEVFEVELPSGYVIDVCVQYPDTYGYSDAYGLGFDDDVYYQNEKYYSDADLCIARKNLVNKKTAIKREANYNLLEKVFGRINLVGLPKEERVVVGGMLYDDVLIAKLNIKKMEIKMMKNEHYETIKKIADKLGFKKIIKSWVE